jgi:IS30 family transposase
MNKHKKLQPEERDRIALWVAQEISQREIARRLSRSPSSIHAELQRNRYQGVYISIYAQNRTEERRQAANRRNPLKSESVYGYVEEHLRQGWSPEQVSGRIKVDYPDDQQMRICLETIYRYIYAPKNQEQQWFETLPRKHRRRRKWRGRWIHRSHIPQRVSIHQRGERIEARKEAGHWEGDTVEGQKHQNGLHTETERVSRYLLALKVKQITSRAAITAQSSLFGSIPRRLRKSTTLDNGRENHLHYQLQKLGMKTFFADPYSSWQRGTNEYHNGLLRRYFPKGTDFATVSEADLADVVQEINDRPRKVLNYHTPYEVFSSLAYPAHLSHCSDLD